MIKVREIEVWGFDHAIRGMRNPMNSWDKSDTDFEDQAPVHYCDFENGDLMKIGPNDLDLMKRLIAAGPEHRKFLRQIFVSMDITAPLYWWKEFDTYKVGTTANSCSTMHKIAAKEFTLDDFSHERIIRTFEYSTAIDEGENVVTRDYLDTYCLLDAFAADGFESPYYAGEIVPIDILKLTIAMLNRARDLYIETKDKKYWWQMIQLLPSSYNQKRTVTMNYENVYSMIRQRTDHRLDEWNEFVTTLWELPGVKDMFVFATEGQNV